MNYSQKQGTTEAHVPFGNETKSAMLGLFKIISLVRSISLLKHQAGQRETSIDCLICRSKELNEHYDNTINEMHVFYFLTDIYSNEDFTFHKAMKQDDQMDFVIAMEKGI